MGRLYGGSRYGVRSCSDLGIYSVVKVVRLIAFYVVGLLLGAVSALAYAQDAIPATVETKPKQAWAYSGSVAGQYKLTAAEACSAIVNSQCTGPTYLGTNNSCKCFSAPFGYDILAGSVWQVNACPAGYTLNGTVCERYTCPAGYTGPQTINGVANMCAPPPKCPMYPGDANTPITQPAGCSCPSGSRWVPGSGCRKTCLPNGAVGGQLFNVVDFPGGSQEACSGGCIVQQMAGEYYKKADGTITAKATWTDWACGGSGEGTAPTADGKPQPPAPELDPDKIKPPKCGAGEGVMTSSSGSVKCVPPGTPSTKEPKVETGKKKETFDDGSTKTTETTKTTDTSTGASHTSTSVVVSAGPTGGTQAGTPGTADGTAEESGECQGDDCGECDPTLQMCGDPSFDGMYEKKDKTFGGVLNDFSSGMQSTPIGEAFTDVFNVNTPSGSCPNLAAYIPFLNTTVDLAPYICSPTGIQYLEVMGTILKIVVGYIALTWVLF